jgi:hypothetical protein
MLNAMKECARGRDRREIRRFFISGIALLTIIAGGAVSGSASELGHYSPGLMNIRDPVQPPPGSYYVQYHLYYESDTLRDKNGNSVDSITAGPVTINIDVDVDSFVVVPTFIHVTGKKVLGANYGFLVAQPFGNASFQAALELQTFPGIFAKADESSFGLGDTYVRPLWLGWNLGRAEIGSSYGLYVPTGKYDAGDADNIGLGMWTHEFMVSGAYYFDEQRGTALTMTGFYEIHHNKEDVDFRPGSHFTLNYGISQYLPLSEKFLSELGIVGFGQWQVTKDEGSDVVDKDAKDQVYGLGLQAGLIYLPWQGQLTFKWIREFKAEDRFEGNFFTLSAAYTF